MKIDIEKIVDILAEVTTTVILPKFRNLEENEISAKSSPNDLVTVTDIAAEAALEKMLAPIYPGAAFVGEERAASDPTIMNGLLQEGASWVIDPIDGTRNFIRGKEEFGSILALVINGEVEYGFIYAAPLGKCAIAIKGEGAYWDGEKIRTNPKPKGETQGLRSMGWLHEPYNTDLVRNLRSEFVTEPAHCSAYGYIELAHGEYDFSFYSRVHPWDHLAGGLLLNELGGRLAFVDDEANLTPAPSADRPMLVTAPGRNWREIKDKLWPTT